MNKYDEGIKIIEKSCGNNKDNIIALATVAREKNEHGYAFPNVREVDAFYEDGKFYITTWGKSNKILQIEENEEVAFSVGLEGIYGRGIAKNLGWVLDPNNAEIRDKVRIAFKDWYDHANNEEDKNCVIMAIDITTVTIFKDHGSVQYRLDLVNKTEIK